MTFFLFSSNSEEHYIDFKKSLLPLIQSSESDDLKSTLMPTEAQWYQLNQLRIHAGAPERSEDGVERLYQYYAQLVAMEKKFPYDTNKIDGFYT